MITLKKIEQTIKKYKMLSLNDKVLVAVSGGPDSVALLDLIFQLSSKYHLKLWIAHFNHKLRGRESDLDQKLVKELAQKYKLKFITAQASPNWWKKQKGSIEEKARELRYQFLLRTAQKIRANKIALGHNEIDQAESFLINLLRGSGALGLSSIPPVRDQFIRPLIETTREEIIHYLKVHSLPFRIDRSNFDQRFLRNRIRSQLLPALKSYNPAIVKTIFRTAEILREEEKFLEENAFLAFDKLAQLEKDKVIFSAQQFLLLPKPIQRRILRLAIAHIKTDLRRISFEHIFQFENLLNSRSRSGKIDLPESVQIQKSYDQIIIQRKKPEPKSQFKLFKLNLKKFSQNLTISKNFKIKILIKPSNYQEFKKQFQPQKRQSIFSSHSDQAWLALDNIQSPLFLRPPKPGDRIQPIGMKGRKKLKDIFMELKIPIQQRKIYPVIASKTQIIWLPGYSISEKARLKPHSRKILFLSLHLLP